MLRAGRRIDAAKMWTEFRVARETENETDSRGPIAAHSTPVGNIKEADESDQTSNEQDEPQTRPEQGLHSTGLELPLVEIVNEPVHKSAAHHKNNPTQSSDE
jgi:hypothetical protein